jgi:hypothetical protein
VSCGGFCAGITVFDKCAFSLFECGEDMPRHCRLAGIQSEVPEGCQLVVIGQCLDAVSALKSFLNGRMIFKSLKLMFKENSNFCKFFKIMFVCYGFLSERLKIVVLYSNSEEVL